MTDLYLRTSVRPETQKKTFRKALFIVLSSLLLIAASEFLLPLLELESLNIWAWLSGFGACGYSAMSHQKLKAKEKNPDLLHGTEDKLSFFEANKQLFSLAWDEIESFHFLDNGKEYGLAFKLKKPIEGLTEKSKRTYGVDLFLPFFSQGSFMLLDKWRDQHVST